MLRKFWKNVGFILIISWVFLGSQPCVNAAVPFVQGKSLEDVLTKVPETYENVNYLYSEESPDDYLGYFTSDRATWQPRIKYTGESDAIDEYFFCLTFHLLAPDGSITYTKGDTESIPEAYYDYAYIIENGFGYRTYDAEEGYDDLLWDYYVTSLAIWQYQYESDLMGDAASSFVSTVYFPYMYPLTSPFLILYTLTLPLITLSYSTTSYSSPFLARPAIVPFSISLYIVAGVLINILLSKAIFFLLFVRFSFLTKYSLSLYFILLYILPLSSLISSEDDNVTNIPRSKVSFSLNSSSYIVTCLVLLLKYKLFFFEIIFQYNTY